MSGSWLRVDLRATFKEEPEDCVVLALWMPDPANELTDTERREPTHVLVLIEGGYLMVVKEDALTYANP